MPMSAATIPVSALPFPVMLIDENQIVAGLSPALAAVLGEHIKGRHFISALRQPVTLEAIETAMRTGQAVQTRWLGRDGARDTTWAVHVIPDAGRIVLTFEDRTAAEEVSQFRRDFVANVSHELRTPLTALQGFIETLRGAARNDAAARERFLGIMERESARMTQLVDDLLSLSRVEEGERQRPIQAIAIGALVAATLADLEPVIAAAQVKVTLTDDTAGASVLGDTNQLRQVFGNLIENAVKYGGTGGTLTVTLDAPAQHNALHAKGIAVHVQDRGPGIAQHHIPRLTERFYRVDTHRSRALGGTGLGLAIVKHIINRHRGRLLIKSALGQGTTFTVILPQS
ncbi:ATP-binding protein [Loktanella salsilacus]|jgi:two-component system phosphate regulon sensor histidine kinase PhoR|uniref:histidine kinase n=1 Tax=Loktanella salsilacus TaxID=195913 RepID=A0A1I4I9M3_9RHOB|nr:ATP-binding protein [Loktanella salsilacus]SFL50985.1 two-component system, OmpR family, phosphate regulon sensor histidine kinase PhoR [Loktanella salsilacus]